MIYYSKTSDNLYTSKVYSEDSQKNCALKINNRAVLTILLLIGCAFSFLLILTHLNFITISQNKALFALPVIIVACVFFGKEDASIERSDLVKTRYLSFLTYLLIFFMAVCFFTWVMSFI